MRLLIVSLASLLGLSACGDGGSPGSSSGGDGGDAADAVDPFDANDAADDALIDSGSDAATDTDSGGTDAVEDIAAETSVDTDATEDCDTLGCACDADADCASGYCLDAVGRDRGVCSELCTESCSEPGFECRLLNNEDGDAVRLCVPADNSYCDPCDLISDCGDLRAACYPTEDGTNVCVTPCDDATRCPSGASCTQITTDDGEGRYCVPDTGICTGCADVDGDLYGVGPDCLGPDEDDNDDTVYDGAPELCDGLDNDGNGEVDDGFDLSMDPENCGECGNACAVERGSTGCIDGACAVTSCPDGFANCDDDASNGCETDLSDPRRCGSCTLPEGEPGMPCGTCGSGSWVCQEDGTVACEGDAGAAVLNACGGCAVLTGSPLEACGTCDSGILVCDGEDALTCFGDEGEDARNACGGCADLDIEPDVACGTCGSGMGVCATAELTVCFGDEGEDARNACGGCIDLSETPGTACGTCGVGLWACAGIDGVVCEGDFGDEARNACGGCGTLPNTLGATCGSCGLDEYVCDGINATTCSGDTVLNACGGCTALDREPGDTCGTCSSGTNVCATPELVVCEGDLGDDARNACGGCGALADTPGTACGTCGSGRWACVGIDGVVCEGDLGDEARNACGGCGLLPNAPGASCGSCGLDEYVCDGTEATTCDGDTTVNSCGGCGVLANPPGASCGSCGLDEYVCEGTEATACGGDTTLNACDGCGLLPNAPGAACGSCGLDEYVCDGTEATTCDGDTTVNACGGCGALANAPGAACGSCGLDEYICDGLNATICSGDTALNSCGGCEPLLNEPGDSCNDCGLSTWQCNESGDEVACIGEPCTCANGVTDAGEENVDCGGPCAACEPSLTYVGSVRADVSRTGCDRRNQDVSVRNGVLAANCVSPGGSLTPDGAALAVYDIEAEGLPLLGSTFVRDSRSLGYNIATDGRYVMASARPAFEPSWLPELALYEVTGAGMVRISYLRSDDELGWSGSDFIGDGAVVYSRQSNSDHTDGDLTCSAGLLSGSAELTLDRPSGFTSYFPGPDLFVGDDGLVAVQQNPSYGTTSEIALTHCRSDEGAPSCDPWTRIWEFPRPRSPFAIANGIWFFAGHATTGNAEVLTACTISDGGCTGRVQLTAPGGIVRVHASREWVAYAYVTPEPFETRIGLARFMDGEFRLVDDRVFCSGCNYANFDLQDEWFAVAYGSSVSVFQLEASRP